MKDNQLTYRRLGYSLKDDIVSWIRKYERDMKKFMQE